MLFADDEIQTNAANFDQIAVVQSCWSWNGHAIHNRNFVARTDVIAVITLINLGGHLRLKPAAKFDGGHGGLADGGQLVGEHVFLGVGSASEHDDSRNLDA